MIDLTETADGVLLPVSAQPGAKRNGLAGVHDGRLKVTVTQVAEKGKANAQIIRLLATSLQLKRSQIRLWQGQTTRLKSFHISGVTLADLHSRLARCFDEESPTE